MTHPFEVAEAFARAFDEAEYGLKLSGFRRTNPDVAEVDWDAFVRALGPGFSEEIIDQGIATTLIGVPPRRLLATMEWSPDISAPLTNIQQLIVEGVYRIRNSLLNGEKLRIGSEDQWECEVANRAAVIGQPSQAERATEVDKRHNHADCLKVGPVDHRC